MSVDGEPGWFPTGDVAAIDPDGFMFITDRSKDVIKSGGEWISSIDLENIAIAHPAVHEAAVIACRHPKWDERPLLVVVPKPGATVSREELLRFFDGKIAKWQIPDDVAVVAELPHTATGKLQKLKLREQFRDHVLPDGRRREAVAAATRLLRGSPSTHRPGVPLPYQHTRPRLIAAPRRQRHDVPEEAPGARVRPRAGLPRAAARRGLRAEGRDGQDRLDRPAVRPDGADRPEPAQDLPVPGRAVQQEQPGRREVRDRAVRQQGEPGRIAQRR